MSGPTWIFSPGFLLNTSIAGILLENSNKKAGVVGYPQVPHHAGLLCDRPPAQGGLPFI
jgi:hypothetical protein